MAFAGADFTVSGFADAFFAGAVLISTLTDGFLTAILTGGFFAFAEAFFVSGLTSAFASDFAGTAFAADFFAGSSLTAGLNFAFEDAFFTTGSTSNRTSGLNVFFFAGAVFFAGATAFFTGAAIFVGAVFFTGATAFLAGAALTAVFLTSAFAGAFFAGAALTGVLTDDFAEAADDDFFEDAETLAETGAEATFAVFTLPDAPFACFAEADLFAFFPAVGTAIRFCFASFFIEKKDLGDLFSSVEQLY